MIVYQIGLTAEDDETAVKASVQLIDPPSLVSGLSARIRGVTGLENVSFVSVAPLTAPISFTTTTTTTTTTTAFPTCTSGSDTFLFQCPTDHQFDRLLQYFISQNGEPAYQEPVT